MSKKLKILVASPEVAPLAKTGGLADVAGSLPKALKSLGHDVRVVLPLYAMVKHQNPKLKEELPVLQVPVGDRKEQASVMSTLLGDTVTTYLIKHDRYYDREYLYTTPQGDYSDNAERFIFFSRAILEMLKQINFAPDIIHINDWQTGLIPTYLKTLYSQDDFFKNTATVFTVHNLGYQGKFWALDMPMTNLPWDVFSINGIEYYGDISFLKAGLMYSDVISTVSKGYSREIQTPEYGIGMEGVLQYRSQDLYGIVNGVDYDEWSPEKDKLIKSHYDVNDLEGKKADREDLLKEFGLKVTADTPIIGMITRLADQKGFDILSEAMPKLMKLNVAMVVLGTGEQKYHDLFNTLHKEYPQKLGVLIAFNNTIAHKIEAGSDMFLMPSKYEPCGLNQMYSLKYGTVPVVRATGGLDDTIQDYDPKTGRGNGFKFIEYSAQALLETVKRAISAFEDKQKWLKLMKNGMNEDRSWKASAKEYVNLYETALKKHASL
ncbi:MAG: glycogen synthase GlgA [bacterium]